MPRPLDLGMASIRQDVLSRTGSAPTSPKTSLISSAGTTPGTGTGSGCGGILSAGSGGAGGGLTGTSSSAANAPNCPQTQPLNLASQRPSHYNVELLRGISGGGGVNSKSLPNIPSAMVRKDKGGCHVGRKSPPTSASSGATKQMLVRRSKSSAILPLRKHLIGEFNLKFLKIYFSIMCTCFLFGH